MEFKSLFFLLLFSFVLILCIHLNVVFFICLFIYLLCYSWCGSIFTLASHQMITAQLINARLTFAFFFACLLKFTYLHSTIRIHPHFSFI